MLNSVPRREVTLREASEERGISYDVLRSWRQWRPDFPQKSRMAGRTALYFDTDIGAFLRRNPNLGRGLGWNRRTDVVPPAVDPYDPDDDEMEVVETWSTPRPSRAKAARPRTGAGDAGVEAGPATDW